MGKILNLRAIINKKNNQINLNIPRKELPNIFKKEFDEAKKNLLNPITKFSIEIKGWKMDG